MKKYRLTFDEPEMEFFRQLFSSQLSVAINTVELVAQLKKKILTAPAEGTPPASPPLPEKERS